MINCKQYVFKVSSGQLDEAGPLDKLQAFQHRLICRHCRAFTNNNRQLSEMLQRYKEDVSSLKPGDEPGPQ